MLEKISLDMIIGLIQTYALPLVWALLIFLLGRFVANYLTGLLAKIMQRSKIDQTLISFTRNLSFVGIMLFVVMAALGKLGIQTTSFAAVIASAGLAVGLSLQGTLGNFAAGVILIVFRPFKAGDFVEVAGSSGLVEDIKIFNTTIKSMDNKEIIVPNGQIAGSTIVNFSAKKMRRIDLVVGVSYKDDLRKVRAVLEAVLKEDGRILRHPEPLIAVIELNSSSVDFAVRPWVKTADYWPTRFTLLEAIKLRFDDEGISIPFPQQDVHIIQQES